jgi:hypothetical protein
MGRLEFQVLTDQLTAAWQFADWPNSPQSCRATPTACFPLLRKSRVVEDPRYYRTMLLHGWEHLLPHWLQQLLVVPRRVGHQVMQRLMHARTWSGAKRAAIGSTLLRSPGNRSPVQ